MSPAADKFAKTFFIFLVIICGSFLLAAFVSILLKLASPVSIPLVAKEKEEEAGLVCYELASFNKQYSAVRQMTKDHFLSESECNAILDMVNNKDKIEQERLDAEKKKQFLISINGDGVRR